MTYSIAIRTLGTAGDKFRMELESIKRLALQPEKVLIYIAEGFPRPEYQIGKEKYLWVKKGMMAQRLLDYEDIDSDLIFFLDDDVELAPYSTDKMIRAIEDNGLDAIGADVFLNHKMTVYQKINSALVNGVVPHFNKHWAFRIRKNASFAYNNRPQKDLYLSQSCAGPAWMIKKDVYRHLNFQDELWLDNFEFAYFDDQLETYKVFRNGYRLGVLYDSGIVHLNAKSGSKKIQNNTRLYNKTKASFAIWWRSIFMASGSGLARGRSVISFFLKNVCSLLPVSIYSLKSLSINPLVQFFKGNIDAWELVHSPEFRALPPYVIAKT